MPSDKAQNQRSPLAKGKGTLKRLHFGTQNSFSTVSLSPDTEKMNDQLPTYSRILDQQPSSVLFHYTSPAGLVGIARSKTIWATDIRFLNDKKEFQHSLDITHSIIEGFFKVNNDPNKLRGLAYDLSVTFFRWQSL